jgi:hypothetical protein
LIDRVLIDDKVCGLEASSHARERGVESLSPTER